MNTSLKVFCPLNKRSDKTKLIPIYLRIVHQNAKAEGRINLSPINNIDYKTWHDPTQRFSDPSLKSHNKVIEIIENQFDVFIRENYEELERISAKEIRDHLLKRNVKESQSLMDYSTYFLEQIIEKDINKAKGTKLNYRKSVNHLHKYLKYKKLENLPYTKFTPSEAAKFIDYLNIEIKEINKHSMTAVSCKTVVKNIKPIFSRLILEEKIQKHPFSNLTIKIAPKFKERIKEEDIMSIMSLDFSKNEKLKVYRDIFLTLCFTGLSYADLYSLNRKSVLKTGYFEIQRNKSGILVRQYVVKQALKIFEIYDEELSCQVNNIVVPKRSLDKINLNLKLLGSYIGLNFPLTTYVARRFFRQSIYNAGIHEPLIVKTLMGHSLKGDMDIYYLEVNEDMLKNAKNSLEQNFDKLFLI